MFHVVFTSLLLLLTVKDVICQSHADFGTGPELSGCMLDVPEASCPAPACVSTTPSLPLPCHALQACNLPADPGPCEALDRRFFFDKADGTCKPFNYGGCQGNGNRFDSKLRCERACIANVPTVGILRKESAGISAIPSSISKQNEICLLPVKFGPCLGHIPSFFFNSTRGRCQGFIYGGCSGNQNRFASLRACQVACLGAAPVAGPQSSANADCNLPKETGYCRAHMPSFFYNKNTGECESFVYGGCGGNANRFDSRSDCELQCKPPGSGPELQPTAERPRFSTNQNCNLPKIVGPCKAYMPSFFYNTGTGQCERFVYGGCGGNANRFETKQECEGKCQRIIYSSSAVQSQNPACLQPKVVGPCRARMPRYFFHQSSQTCELFYYGGCGGNSNNFRTLEGCEGACVSSETVQDVCALPKVTGPCFAAFPRFYFDKTAGRCKTFTYGGCHGNQNNFRSLRACRNTCPGN